MVVIRLVSSLCIALVVTIVVMQNDPWFLDLIEREMNAAMSTLYDCRFTAHLEKIDILTGSILCTQVCAKSRNGYAWQWQAQQASLEWAWYHFFLGEKAPVTTTVLGFDLLSAGTIEKQGCSLAIIPHVLLLVAPTDWDLPFVFDHIVVQNAQLNIEDVGKQWQVAGTFVLDAQIGTDSSWLSITCQESAVSLVSGPRLYVKHCSGRVSIPLDTGLKKIRGSCHAQGSIENGDQKLPYKLEVVLTQDKINVRLGGSDDNYQLHATAVDDSCSGEFIWLEKGTKKSIPWRYTFADRLFSATIASPHVPCALQSWCSHASAQVDKHEAKLMMYGPTGKAEVIVGFEPIFHLKKLTYQQDGINVIDAHGSARGFGGVLDVATMQHIVMRLAGIALSGEGSLVYTGSFDFPFLTLKATMHDASLRIANTYTLIQGLDVAVDFDIAHRCAQVRDAKLTLHKGTLSCSQATAYWQSDGTLHVVHVPLIFNRCFVGWKKDLFASISGHVMCTYRSDRPSNIQGAVIAHQGHVRGNILSAEFQQDLFAAIGSGRSAPSSIPEVYCDVSYRTCSPIEIKTPFLEGAVMCNGSCTGLATQLAHEATLSFTRGTLNFPYRPLFINKGVIEVRPEAPDDPLIEIHARNRIKKYDVALTVTGTPQHPSIVFDSSPLLEPAQILTLLLGGSEDGSLYFLMPKVMTETLESLLFGSSETTVRVQKYVKNLFHPLKNVSITPRLSDQAGRGGVRGSLELEVNERLRCVIEKNMSLPEDVTIEVAYDVSDDATLRAKRDERGDLGLEGEMRWKF